LPEELVKLFISDIFMALIYLQSEGFAHRDIKLKNLLLDSSLNIKLGDFGISKHLLNDAEKNE